MEAKKIIGWSAAAAALYMGVLRGSNALFIGIQNFALSSVDLQANTANFLINFVIRNPLFVGIKLKSIAGDIYVQGIKCGTVQNRYDYYMSGRATHTIPVSVTINLAGLTEALVANIKTGNIQTLTIDFDGGVNVGDTGLVYIPIQKTIRWNEIRRKKPAIASRT